VPTVIDSRSDVKRARSRRARDASACWVDRIGAKAGERGGLIGGLVLIGVGIAVATGIV
jgi:hypothetical protein